MHKIQEFNMNEVTYWCCLCHPHDPPHQYQYHEVEKKDLILGQVHLFLLYLFLLLLFLLQPIKE